MADKKTTLWKRVVGYAVFALLSLLITFFLTFPYEGLKERIRAEVRPSGYELSIGSMGPGFFAVRASHVEVTKRDDPSSLMGGAAAAPDDGAAPAPPAPLMIDSVSVSPTLFPPGLGVKLKLMGGTIATRVSGLSTKRIVIDAEDLDLSKGNLKDFSGIDFGGQVEAHLDLSIPSTAAAPGAAADPDLAQSSGFISIETKGLVINGGEVKVTVAQYGPEPTPFPLPKIVIGEIGGKVKIEKGVATVEDFRSKSADIEANVTGTIKLAKRIDYAEPNMEVRFKPDPEFQKRLGVVGSALSFVGPDPKDPSWRMGRLTGYLGRPKFP